MLVAWGRASKDGARSATASRSRAAHLCAGNAILKLKTHKSCGCSTSYFGCFHPMYILVNDCECYSMCMVYLERGKHFDATRARV